MVVKQETNWTQILTIVIVLLTQTVAVVYTFSGVVHDVRYLQIAGEESKADRRTLHLEIQALSEMKYEVVSSREDIKALSNSLKEHMAKQ